MLTEDAVALDLAPHHEPADVAPIDATPAIDAPIDAPFDAPGDVMSALSERAIDASLDAPEEAAVDDLAEHDATDDATGDATDDAAETDVVDGPDGAEESATDASEDLSPETSDAAVTVGFPFRPEGCGYVIRRVSPGVTTADGHQSVAGAEPRPRNLHLTFEGEAESSVVVQWSTDADTLASEVRFGTHAERLDRVARGFSFTYAGAPGRREHEVHLCGLSAGSTYYYDAGGEAARSGVFRFSTAPAGATAVRALVAGDTRTHPEEWTHIAAHALAEGADLMVFTGDAVSSGANQSEWDALFEASPELFATLPTVWTHGNHEGLAEPYLAQFALPDHGGERGVEEWYALRYGPLELIALNDSVALESDLSVAQVDFLHAALGALDRRRVPFAVAMHHMPMFTTSSFHPPNTRAREAWAPLFDRYGVNVDLSGHVHSYESTLPLRASGEVATSATGTRYFNFGGGGASLYGFVEAAPWILTRESTRGYGVLTATATTLVWTAHRDDGSVIETVDLRR